MGVGGLTLGMRSSRREKTGRGGRQARLVGRTRPSTNKQREDFRAGLAGRKRAREVASAPSKATFSNCISAVLYKTATKNRKPATAMEYKQACAAMLTAHLPRDPFLNSSEHRAYGFRGF
jgi:hypothetical protein